MILTFDEELMQKSPFEVIVPNSVSLTVILHLANHDKVVLPHIAQLHHHQVLGDGDHAVHLHARQVCVPSGTCQEGNMFHMISYKCFHI